MTKTLKIATIQTALEWENPQANLKHFDYLLEHQLKEKVDIIVLPEMFTTGFTMNVENNYEEENGTGLTWMKEKAKAMGTVITGSVIVKKADRYYNRLYWVDEQGVCVGHYDKRHLFRMANETDYFSPGNATIITEKNGFKIYPLICYDLRFPVWSRNIYDKETDSHRYEVLIYIANWPAARSDAWVSLLKARAIENQCYVVGVNRIGEDGKGIPYSGDSRVFDAKGQVLYQAKPDAEEIAVTTLELGSLSEFRTKFPVGLDADRFQLEK